MLFRSVLARRAVEFLNVRDHGVYVDATFGGGGYAREILAAAACSVIGIDRDPSALARGVDLVAAAEGRLGRSAQKQRARAGRNCTGALQVRHGRDQARRGEAAAHAETQLGSNTDPQLPGNHR